MIAVVVAVGAAVGVGDDGGHAIGADGERDGGGVEQQEARTLGRHGLGPLDGIFGAIPAGQTTGRE
jgi:hypothetical protein